MAILKNSDFPSVLRSLAPSVCTMLIHGPDDGAVREKAQALVQTLVPQKDPFNPFCLTEEEMSFEGVLREELFSISLFGGRRIVWIKSLGPKTTKACLALLMKQGSFPGFLVIESAALPKTSKIRMVCEQTSSALSLALYEEQPQDIQAAVLEKVKKEGMIIEGDAVSDFVALVGTHRALVWSELEKIIHYCYDQKRITKADVWEICGDYASLSLEDLFDTAFLGDMAKLPRRMLQAHQQNLLGNPLLLRMGSHISRLKHLRHKIEMGQSADHVVKFSKPPIFFLRHRAIIRSLSLWTFQELCDLEERLFYTLAETRETPSLERELSERFLLLIAQKAKAF